MREAEKMLEEVRTLLPWLNEVARRLREAERAERAAERTLELVRQGTAPPAIPYHPPFVRKPKPPPERPIWA
jgi:hypothetical protein